MYTLFILSSLYTKNKKQEETRNKKQEKFGSFHSHSHSPFTESTSFIYAIKGLMLFC